MVSPDWSPRRRCRATVLALGVWLTGCYTMSVEAPRDAESRRARRVLKRHLVATLPFAKFGIEQLPVSAPGWTVFGGELERSRHGDQRYWVVRADGSVVTEEPLAELSRIYRSLDAVRPDSPASAEELSWFAVALLVEQDIRLYDQRWYERDRAALRSDELAAPQLVRQDGAATLVFWVYTVGRGVSLKRYELQIAADYELSVSASGWRPLGEFRTQPG